MTWILVFWLQFPENFTVYEKFSDEYKCIELERIWNVRLKAVNSKLVAECRVGK